MKHPTPHAQSALVSRSAATNREVSVLPHDRVKKVPLTSFDSSALLRAVGIADGSGAVKASMRGKYDQVNEFLRIVGEVLGEDAAKPRDRPFTVVDCGCGKAYLTVALYHYLVHSLGVRDVRVVGIDRRADVISSARKAAESLGVADNVEFVEADLADFKPREEGFRADMVVSLHACDTATDEAMARGVEWKSKFVLAAPCCQHELQKSLASGRTPPSFSALVRQPILRFAQQDISFGLALHPTDKPAVWREEGERHATVSTEFHQARAGPHIAERHDGLNIYNRYAKHLLLIDGDDHVHPVLTQVGLWGGDIESVKQFPHTGFCSDSVTLLCSLQIRAYRDYIESISDSACLAVWRVVCQKRIFHASAWHSR